MKNARIPYYFRRQEKRNIHHDTNKHKTQSF